MILNGLKIHAINVNSIARLEKRHELFAHIKKYNPDVLLLSETGLNNRHVLDFAGYSLFRNDKSVNTRGTCILVRSNLCASRFLPTQQLVNPDFTAIKLNCGLSDIIIVATYFKSRTLNCIDLEYFLSLQDDRTSIIIAGDFNARHYNWSNNAPNTNGTRLYNWLRSATIANQIELLAPTSPTFVSHLGASVIDLCLVTRSIATLPYSTNTISYPSDHLAVEFTFTMTVTKFSDPPMSLEYSGVN